MNPGLDLQSSLLCHLTWLMEQFIYNQELQSWKLCCIILIAPGNSQNRVGVREKNKIPESHVRVIQSLPSKMKAECKSRNVRHKLRKEEAEPLRPFLTHTNCSSEQLNFTQRNPTWISAPWSHTDTPVLFHYYMERNYAQQWKLENSYPFYYRDLK